MSRVRIGGAPPQLSNQIYDAMNFFIILVMKSIGKYTLFSSKKVPHPDF